MTQNQNQCCVYLCDLKLSGDMYYSFKRDVLFVPFLEKNQSLAFVHVKSIKGLEFLFNEHFEVNHFFYEVMSDLVCQVMENQLVCEFTEEESILFRNNVKSFCSLRKFNKELNSWEDSFDF